ncbi:hypothetical protein EON64_11835, partial [archaeon]
MFIARSSSSTPASRRITEDSDAEQASEDGGPSISTIDEAAPHEEIEETEEYFQLTTVELPTLDIVHQAFKSDGKGDGKEGADKEVNRNADNKSSVPAIISPQSKLFMQPNTAYRCCYYSALGCVRCSRCMTCDQLDSMHVNDDGIFDRDEKDLVTQYTVTAHNNRDKAETAPLLRAVAGDGESEQQEECVLEERNYRADREGGLYRSRLPVLAPILLRGERLAPYIARYTPPYTLLSRATQRILRDIHMQYLQHLASLPAPETETGSREAASHAMAPLPETSLLELLTQYATHQLPGHQLDESPKHLVLPPISTAYGGVLGRWKDDVSSVQRIGNIPSSLSKLAMQGSVLRIFLHQLVVTEHPLMLPEERAAAELREIFTGYATLFDNKLLEHLVGRIHGLCTELRVVTRQHVRILTSDDEDKELDSDTQRQLHALYTELLSLVPTLHETSRLTHSLTSRVYGKFEELCEFRRRQGLVATPIGMLVRKLKSNLQALLL